MRQRSVRLLSSWMIDAALCCILSASAAAQSAIPDTATYESWLREAYAAAQRRDRIGLEEAADRLMAATAVRMPDGTIVSVNNSWLQEALLSPTPDFPLITARLGALIDAAALPPSSAPADALERLDRLLAAPPFDRLDRSGPETPQWLIDVFDWLARLLEMILRPVEAVPPTATTVVAWVIALIGVVLLLAVIVYLLINLRRGFVHDARLAAAGDDPMPTATEAFEQASALARDGDYRAAVRSLYLSALLWLDEQDLLCYDRALTNREYLERARSNPALLARLTPVIETFDQVWYGHLPIDASAFAAYRQQIEALRRELGARRI
ncbi:MAG: DUF4129 domain-containing protein [Roseiflexus sp.]|nr:DUF4129 domain-containing protein [Roseiflexus sp.]MCS7287520.1 DUF4129 domain-containing protein [Roseiflexus sp.]MDW8148610.1 DUF4129 domain-containing protein [Roseiflexaceae bacterium]MDW8231741.1 DUF4129 domain-containing protein [Roseiflexaceae bacterium]